MSSPFETPHNNTAQESALTSPAIPCLKDFSGEDQIKRQRILDVACTLLESQEYRDISMDNIAKKAGMSKKTLYLYFPSKHILLEQLILEKLFSPLTVFPSKEDEDIETQLSHFLLDLAHKLFNEKHLGLLRAIIGETTRSPSVQKLMNDLFHLATPDLGLQKWLTLQQEKGTLKISSSKDAADYLFGLTLCVPLLSQLSHCGPMREEKDFAHFIKEGIRIFLSAYSVQPEKHST